MPFGGGSGAGVTINPIAFLVIQEENVKLMPVNYSSSIDKLLDYIPDLLDKTNNMINKCMQKSKDKETVKGKNKEEEQKKSEKVKMDKSKIEEDLDESRHIKERIEKTKKPIEEEITYEYEYDETLDDE